MSTEKGALRQDRQDDKDAKPPGHRAANFPASMTSRPPTTCAACGSQVTGRFCAHCGAPADSGSCAACGTQLAPGARFCHRCGAPIAVAKGAAGRERLAWLVAGIAVVVLSVVVLWRGGALRPAPPPEMANPGNQTGAAPGQPPDISNMSPEERFDRLWDRVMRAAEAGDSGTVTQFSPMALGAYNMLPSVNADQRFHAALLYLAIADYPAATALADTILAQSPGHLFGYIIRGDVADRKNQLKPLNQAYRDFLSHYDAELKSGRPEYGDHRPLLDSFRTRAQASTP